MSTEENWIWHPDGLGMATLVVTVVLAVLCIIVVGMRTWTRIQTGKYGLDDGLMIIAVGIYTACCVFTCLGVYTGLGTADGRLNTWNKTETTKNIIFFQLTYACSLPFIKASICLTMLRIITEKPYRITIWAAMAASVASGVIGFIAVASLCQPISFYWDTSIKGGWCASVSIITGLSYMISVLAIITDWTCSLVPCIVVWNLQMKSRLKVSVCAVLALGIVASAATVIRLPYLRYYNIVTNYDYNVCNILLWSIIECGVGILAGSLPSLRTLLKSWIDKSSKGSSYRNTPGSYAMNPQSSSKRLRGESMKMGYMTPKGRGTTTTVSASQGGQGPWIELDDDSSQKHIIHRTVQVSVDVSENTSIRD